MTEHVSTEILKNLMLLRTLNYELKYSRPDSTIYKHFIDLLNSNISHMDISYENYRFHMNLINNDFAKKESPISSNINREDSTDDESDSAESNTIEEKSLDINSALPTSREESVTDECNCEDVEHDPNLTKEQLDDQLDDYMRQHPKRLANNEEMFKTPERDPEQTNQNPPRISHYCAIGDTCTSQDSENTIDHDTDPLSRTLSFEEETQESDPLCRTLSFEEEIQESSDSCVAVGVDSE